MTTPIRVIIHAGYHKTGTTSLQDFMRDNRKALAPYCAYYGKSDFLAAGSHARVYSQRPFAFRLWLFRRAFRRFLATTPSHSTIVLSRESFSGGMPGHRKITGRMMMGYFKPSKKLADVMVAEIQKKFGQGTEIIFFYTTREKENWIRSVHGHLLRSIRLADSFESFRARFLNLASPEEEAAKMVKHLHPIRVITSKLEDTKNDHCGPATGLLELLEIPLAERASFHPAQVSNTGQADVLRDRMLDLNQSELSKTDLRHEKETILKTAQGGEK